MSELEDTLAFQLTAAGVPFERQFKAIPGRRFRWDFRVGQYLIEVQGGIWRKGGHTTGTGITRDCNKANLAALAGWRTLFITAGMIDSGEALRVIQEANGRDTHADR